MALLSKLVTVTSPQYAGAYATTGLGFQPKALIVFHPFAEYGTDVNTQDAGWFLGFATATTQSSGGYYVQGGATNQVGADNTLIYLGTRGVATLQSMDADGFTLNWSNAPGSSPSWYDVSILALGGDDVLGTYAGVFTPSGATGNQAISGVGYQPNTLLAISTRISSAGASSIGNTSIMHSFGVAVGSAASEQWVQSLGVQYANNNRVRTRQQDGSFLRMMSDTDGNYGQASLGSFDHDGFTINWSVAGANTSWRTYYLALNVAHPSVGTFTQPSTAVTQAITGAGMKPQALMLASFGAPATAGYSSTLNNLMGMGDGTTQVAATFRKDDGVSNYAIARREDTSVALATNYTGAAIAHASLGSLDTDGFTLDWTLSDGVLRETKYLAFGAPAGPIYVDDSATLASAASLTTSGRVDRAASMQATSLASSSATPTAQRVGIVTSTGLAGMTASAARDRTAALGLTAWADLVVAPARVAVTRAALASTTALDVQLARDIIGAIDLNGALSLAAVNERVRWQALPPLTIASTQHVQAHAEQSAMILASADLVASIGSQSTQVIHIALVSGADATIEPVADWTAAIIMDGQSAVSADILVLAPLTTPNAHGSIGGRLHGVDRNVNVVGIILQRPHGDRT